jgi:hypothetical protein
MRQQLGKLHASGQGTKIEVERALPVGELNQDFVEVVPHQRKKFHFLFSDWLIASANY